MNKVTISLITGSCGLFAGILLGSPIKDLGKVAAMSELASIPMCYVGHLIIEGKANQRVSKAEKKASESVTALDRAKSKLSDLEKGHATLINDLESLKSQLQSSEADRLQLSNMVETLTPAISSAVQPKP